LPGAVGLTFQSLRSDLRTGLLEASSGRRFSLMVKRLLKYVIAALLHGTGLTGPFLRGGLRRKNACLILGYHGVSGDPPRLLSRGHSISNVRDHLRYLSRHLRPVTLEEISGAISRGEAPPAASFAVTFDDGFRNNVIHAIPVLREMDLPATFFVPSRPVESGDDLWISSLREMIYSCGEGPVGGEAGVWPELHLSDDASRYAAYFQIKQALKSREGTRRELLARLASRMGEAPRPPEEDRVVDAAMLAQMARDRFTVGAHSRTHPILSGLAPAEAREEIEGSRRDLEARVGAPVLDFAYPNGRFADFNDATCRLVAEAGYRCAVTTEPGTVRRGDDRLALRRCMPDNVPAFLASFDLLTRVWADRRRDGDLTQPVRSRLSHLAPSKAGSVA
jgi:peptidoglycan/xylan/chitin deacetylase (PgdA/CDA1 family)